MCESREFTSSYFVNFHVLLRIETEPTDNVGCAMCGFRKLKEQGMRNRAFGAVLVPKSLLLLLLLFRTPPPAGT